MREEIEQLLDDDKCWEDVYIHGVKEDRQFSQYLAAIELEKYFIQKEIELLQELIIEMKEKWGIFSKSSFLLEDKIKELQNENK